ncbi:MAG: dickkopf-related protein [Myxococcota bacterium]
MRSVVPVLIVAALTTSSCSCVSEVHISGMDGGAGGASGGGTGGGAGGGVGGGGGAAGGGSGPLVITPQNATIDVNLGQQLPQQFSARLGGVPVSPTWGASPNSLGLIDGSGRFLTTGTSGGVATVTAEVGGLRATTRLTVRLHVTQNGATGTGGGSGAGGVGGVGGEGPGGPVTPAVATVLQGTPSADPGLAMLYPYDATVWPRELLAPLLQWKNGARDPDAVAIHLECPAFVYDGTFARTATPFIHHPIPQDAWRMMGEACAGQSVTLRLVFAAQGVAYGPLTETWKIAPGSLKGVVYYNSYGTKLAYNFSGALGGNGQFGGATLAIKGNSTDPVLVAGRNGSHAECRVCHTVSGDGSTLLSQRGDDYGATSHYALRAGNAETAMSPGGGRLLWGGLTRDGSRLLSNSAPLTEASTAPTAFFQIPGGAEIPTTGLPAGFRAGTPVFSPDDSMVAFLWFAGGSSADQRTLAMMRYTAPATFSDLTPLYTPPVGQAALYPSFLPTGKGVVFQVETQSNGRGLGETRSTCDDSGPCSDVGAHGELWWVDIATKQARRLDNANGKGHAPVGPNAHDDDSTLNYEATVAPIPSGGYAWVIFTSRRMYGNVATINPFWSDPRFHDISQQPTTKKLWVAAIDLNAQPGTDPSHPAFYLPAQELLAGNSRGYWSLEPCHSDGEGCESGDQCCGGFCRGATEGAPPVCQSSGGGGCAQEFERCTTDADCCNHAQGMACVNQRCVVGIQ